MKKLLYLIICLVLFNNQMFSQEEEKPTAEGARHPILEDKFYIEAGAFIPQKDIKFGASGDIDNEDIDFGQTFNFNDNEATFFFNGEWRWNKKWRLTGEYFAVNNAARATLERDIVLDSLTFEKGTFARGGIEFALFRVFVGRTISSGPKHSLGAGLGVHMINIGAFIEGEIRTDQGDKEFRAPRASFLIPLPNIGAWYHWAPNEKWAFVARVDYFGITIDKYSGGLWNLAPGIKYQIIKNLGIGLDYRVFFLNARVDDEIWEGEFDMNFAGPLITLHGNF